MSRYFLYLFAIIFLNSYFCQSDNFYRLCVDERTTFGHACHVLESGNSPVACILVTDSVDCAIKIQKGQADFGLFTGEEALLASYFINDDVQVIGQLRHRDKLNESDAFQSVVVVKASYPGGFEDLRGKNYCHPGFQKGLSWTDRVLKEFEYAVVPRIRRENHSSSYQEMYSLSNFFNAGCRPGEWTPIESLDNKLKKEFGSLCALCDSPNWCTYSETTRSLHEAALNCLTKNSGDVAYVSLQRVKEYFGLMPGFEARSPPEDYKFLCPQYGEVQSLNKPCPWVKQPWTAIIASRRKASELQQLIPSWLANSRGSHTTWENAFRSIVEGPDFIVYNMSNMKLLVDYIQESRAIPFSWADDHHKRIRLCVTMDENTANKCLWLKQAVITHGIEPELSCVAASNISQCLKFVKENQADIATIDTDYGYIARSKYNLSAIMYQDGMNNRGGNFLIVAVVPTSKDVSSLSNLKGKKVCFPVYGGAAWISAINTLRAASILPNTCPHALAAAKFFNQSCVPGISDFESGKEFSNLCSICSYHANESVSCSLKNNRYYGDTGPLNCLAEQDADVAFIDYWKIPQVTSNNKFSIPNTGNLTILCKNGTRVPFRGRDISTDCAFASGIKGEIVARRPRTAVESTDMMDMLLRMDDWIGEKIFTSLNVIDMYGPFNGKRDLIFKTTTVDLVPSFYHNYEYTYPYVGSYVELQSKANEPCIEHSGSSTYTPHIIFSFILSIFISAISHFQ